jgi:exonuclease VII small subunit
MIAFLAKLFGGSSMAAGIALAVVLGIGGYIGILKFEIWGLENDVARLENEKAALKVDVAFEQGEVKACKATVEQTNMRIEDLREDRDNRERMFDLLQDNVDLIRESTSGRIADLDKLPTPKNCEDAMQLLRDGLGERK